HDAVSRIEMLARARHRHAGELRQRPALAEQRVRLGREHPVERALHRAGNETARLERRRCGPGGLSESAEIPEPVQEIQVAEGNLNGRMHGRWTMLAGTRFNMPLQIKWR